MSFFKWCELKEAKKSVAVVAHSDIDNWLKSVDSLAKDLKVLQDAKEKAKAKMDKIKPKAEKEPEKEKDQSLEDKDQQKGKDQEKDLIKGGQEIEQRIFKNKPNLSLQSKPKPEEDAK